MKRNQILIMVIAWAMQVFLFCQIPVDFTTNTLLAFICMGLFFLGWIPYYIYFTKQNLKETGEN